MKIGDKVLFLHEAIYAEGLNIKNSTGVIIAYKNESILARCDCILCGYQSLTWEFSVKIDKPTPNYAVNHVHMPGIHLMPYRTVVTDEQSYEEI